MEYGFDTTFEPYVAIPISEFVLSESFERQRIWIAKEGDKVVGSIAIVEGSEELAQLRWLLVHPDYRGFGIGTVFVEEALRFASNAGYEGVFLWTVNTLKAAKHIYESFHFKKKNGRENTQDLG